MKKIILPLLAIMMISSVFAQNYYIIKRTGTSSDYSLGNGTATVNKILTTGNDILSAAQTIPFTWNYYGSPVTSFKASDNGYITFDAAASTTTGANTSVPNAGGPNDAIYAFWDDLELKTYNSYAVDVRTWTTGNTGDRMHYIQWMLCTKNGVPVTTAHAVYFAIRLKEKGGFDVVFNYGFGQTFSGTIGCENSDGSKGIQYTGSPNLNCDAAVGNWANATDAVYEFNYGVQPAYDAEGALASIPDYFALTEAPFTIDGTFFNAGANAITACDINYTINDGPKVTAQASSVNIPKNGTQKLSHPTKWTTTKAGIYKVTVWLSNLNGNADGIGSNDSVTKMVNVVPKFVVRLPLHEVFTSSTCPPCNPGNYNLDVNVLPNFPDQYTEVKYQMNYPGTGDPYYTAECGSRHTYYGINSIPRMEVDGGWNGNAGSYTISLFNQFKAKPALMKIEATHIINFKRVEVSVKLTPVADLDYSNLRLFVVVLEKQTTKNVKTNGETEFVHVMKKMLPNATGTAIGSIVTDATKTFPTMTYTVPGNYRLPPSGQSNIINLATENSIEELTDCEVVVFVQDVFTKEVYQSANSTGTIVSVDDINKVASGIAIYPNPSAGTETFIKFNLNNNSANLTMKVYNTLGQVVETIENVNFKSGSNQVMINTSNYAKGVYTVKIEGTDFTSSEKFVIE